MDAVLKMEPRTPPLTKDQFIATAEPFSVALDGYVIGGPFFLAKAPQGGPVVNFNHHEEVDRLATRATCAQVLMAIRQGFFQTFTRVIALVNDCDQDVCTSWVLLKHASMAETVWNPRLNRLVMMEDALDTTAGAYPYPIHLPVLRELAWVFEPYSRFRASGGLARRNADEFRGVVEDVEQRILAHILGNGSALDLQMDYRTIGGGTGWSLVQEQGAQARTKMFADGISAFVSVKERLDGTLQVVGGRMSPYVPFPSDKIIRALNEAERCGTDCWGGSENVWGSPRIAGTKLSLQELKAIVEEQVRLCTEIEKK